MAWPLPLRNASGFPLVAPKRFRLCLIVILHSERQRLLYF